MEKCLRQNENKKRCNCSYEPCSKKGICCECIQYHLSRQELPACAFPDDIERSWDRSFQRFVEVCKEKYGITA